MPSEAFDFISGMMIVAGAMLIGFETESMAATGQPSPGMRTTGLILNA